MAFDPSRRIFLKGAGLAAVGVGAAPTSFLVRLAHAAQAGSTVLVQVFLRGGADGLNLCVPYGVPEYYDLRGAIALPRPGQSGGVLDLDGTFGLHPALAPLKPIFDDRRLAFLHAAGNYNLSRSHFDAQDFMETGTPGDKATTTGWMSRALTQIPGNDVLQGGAVSQLRPRSFLGPEPLLVTQDLAAFDLRARTWKGEAESLLRVMHQADQRPVARVAREAFDAITVLRSSPAVGAPPSNGAAYPAGAVGNAFRTAAALIKADLGTRCVFINVGGAYDTHANQLGANVTDFGLLGQALQAFDTDLGRRMDDVALAVTTEFGRTAAVNGSAGTDHGSGMCMIGMGGRVRGGRVHGRWPGLSRSALHENRDLAVTTDFRDVFAEMARVQLGLGGSLFPGYNPAPVGLFA